jgi:hypothetical protein
MTAKGEKDSRCFFTPLLLLLLLQVVIKLSITLSYESTAMEYGTCPFSQLELVDFERIWPIFRPFAKREAASAQTVLAV